MIVHKIRRGLKSRIPLDADRIVSAVLSHGGGSEDIASKYDKKGKFFLLNYEDTEELDAGTLVVTYTKSRKRAETTIHLES